MGFSRNSHGSQENYTIFPKFSSIRKSKEEISKLKKHTDFFKKRTQFKNVFPGLLISDWENIRFRRLELPYWWGPSIWLCRYPRERLTHPHKKLYMSVRKSKR